jgi:hypothetical protein
MLETVMRDRSWVSEIGREAALWILMIPGGAIVSGARLDDCALIAALGILAVFTRRSAAVLVPLAVAALVDPQLIPWALAAAALTQAPRTRVAAPRLDSELQRQLMRNRRRAEPATILIASGGSLRAPAAREVLETMRLTDAVEVAHAGGHCEIRAVLDGDDIDRAAVERRIRDSAGVEDIDFGWALFPGEGVTLDVLVGRARARLDTRDTRHAEPEPLQGAAGPRPSMARAG